MGYSPADAAPYSAGVDRSPTEIAALFLADHPDGDPVEFLIEACGLDEADASAAVDMLDPPWVAREADPGPTRDVLVARAGELGVKVRANASVETLLRAIAAAETQAVRAQLEDRARAVLAPDDLDGIDAMTDDELAAAVAATEASQG